ncbi:excalibur calcium-binding domain-containing protein [Sporosarcina sp. FSL K6-3508]|uniref:excalibur calcium-binding domain-containing protein n=1 Tax=Sporosarcina sp. FSL K6-3508 TaxID=2921557 RepID=UPI00315A1D62
MKEGLARVAYVYLPNTRYLDEFEKAEQQAKKSGVGIWILEDYATDRGFDSYAYPVKEKIETTVSDEPKEVFQNCTELRKKYPNGVKKGHPAYSIKMDGDRDGFACE